MNKKPTPKKRPFDLISVEHVIGARVRADAKKGYCILARYTGALIEDGYRFRELQSSANK